MEVGVRLPSRGGPRPPPSSATPQLTGCRGLVPFGEGGSECCLCRDARGGGRGMGGIWSRRSPKGCLGDTRWHCRPPGQAPPGAAVCAAGSGAGREPGKPAGTGKRVGAREVPGTLPGGHHPWQPGAGVFLSPVAACRDKREQRREPPLPGRLRQSRKAPVPSVVPGQGPGRRLRGREGVPSAPSGGTQRGSAPPLSQDRPLPGSSRPVSPAAPSGVGAGGTRAPRRGSPLQGRRLVAPGLVCGAPLPPCPPPPHAGAGRDPPPHRCPAAAPPGGVSPPRAPPPRTPPSVYLRLPRLRCGRPARGSSRGARGCRGGSGCGAGAGAVYLPLPRLLPSR